MNLRTLESPTPDADPFRSGVDRLIASVGTPQFEQALFDVSAEATHCSHLTAFVSAPARPPRVVLAVNFGPVPVARSVAHIYVRQYWNLDPANDVEGSALPDQGVMMRLRSDEIGSNLYRSECYTGVDLSDRLSLMQRCDDKLYRLNFYCAARDAMFADRAVDRILGGARMLLALVARHDHVMRSSADQGRIDFATKLRDAHPAMPGREVQVCDGIARGLTSEGIALENGIAINTVLTYRRRAYARLGISSQNELLHLLLTDTRRIC